MPLFKTYTFNRCHPSDTSGLFFISRARTQSSEVPKLASNTRKTTRTVAAALAEIIHMPSASMSVDPAPSGLPPSRSSYLDFDVPHFYAQEYLSVATSMVSIPLAKHSPITLSTSPHIPLISLAAAQRRPSIRKRKEGFEMRTIGAQELISLQDAQAREDIRRRGFELTVRQGTSVSPRNNKSLSRRLPQFTTVGDKLSYCRTEPSLYSLGDSMEAIFQDSHSAGELSYQGSILGERLHLETDGRTSRPRRDVADCSSSSIDEESFLRMAAPLGW